jgi:glycosyltransferase involved in cell wall biosynthesis
LPWYRDFPVHHLPGLALLPSVLAWGGPVLAAAARSLRLDIVHDPCGIAPFLAPRLRTRRVVTVHDAIPYIHPRLQPLLTRAVFRILVPAARWTADAVIAVSECARSDLIRHTRLPAGLVHAIYPGVLLPGEDDLRRWQAAEETEDAPYLLYVGDLSPRKNVVRLLAAFAQVRDQYAEVRLVVAGPETWGSGVVMDAARGLGDGVQITGYVDEERLHILYANAAALVYPSLYEGFGLPPLEAMAHGTPVIASRTSSLPEVMGDAGLLIDPLDVDALAAAMTRILADIELRACLSTRGRARASAFTWEQTARSTLAVYKSVLSEGRA